MNIDAIANRSLSVALKRGKISPYTDDKSLHLESLRGLCEELAEFSAASETTRSKHLPAFSEAEEELADIALVALTELSRRSISVEQLLLTKISFNENR